MEPTLVRDLEQFITAPPPDEHSFNALALRLFEHQYIANLPFQRVCRQRGRTPVTVGHWRDIPAVPIHAFKEFTLSATDPAMCQRVFKTSGTTQGAVRGQHFHPHLEIYDLSMRVNFQRHIMRQHSKMRIMVLFPDEKLMPHSSLAHYLELAIRYFGSPDSRHYIDAHGLCLDSWYSDLLQACQHQQPVLLLGASYSLLHACDALAARDQSVRLPPGSCIMDTGGFKGQSRELGADEFYATLQARLGVEPAACQNMYGMTELSSQFYDRARVPGRPSNTAHTGRVLAYSTHTAASSCPAAKWASSRTPTSAISIRHSASRLKTWVTRPKTALCCWGGHKAHRPKAAHWRWPNFYRRRNHEPVSCGSFAWARPPSARLDRPGPTHTRLRRYQRAPSEPRTNSQRDAHGTGASPNPYQGDAGIRHHRAHRCGHPQVARSRRCSAPATRSMAAPGLLTRSRVIAFANEPISQNFPGPRVAPFCGPRPAQPQSARQLPATGQRGCGLALGPDLLLHLWAGNVAGLSLWSLVCGLLVKAGNVGKLASTEPVVATIFVQLLIEIEPRWRQALALLWWQGGDTELQKRGLCPSPVHRRLRQR